MFFLLSRRWADCLSAGLIVGSRRRQMEWAISGAFSRLVREESGDFQFCFYGFFAEFGVGKILWELVELIRGLQRVFP